MKNLKFSAIALSALLVFSSCNMNNTTKGGLIGGGGGAVTSLVRTLVVQPLVLLSVVLSVLVLVCSSARRWTRLRLLLRLLPMHR